MANISYCAIFNGILYLQIQKDIMILSVYDDNDDDDDAYMTDD